mgnify:CR=1 FL=1
MWVRIPPGALASTAAGGGMHRAALHGADRTRRRFSDSRRRDARPRRRVLKAPPRRGLGARVRPLRHRDHVPAARAPAPIPKSRRGGAVPGGTAGAEARIAGTEAEPTERPPEPEARGGPHGRRAPPPNPLTSSHGPGRRGPVPVRADHGNGKSATAPTPGRWPVREARPHPGGAFERAPADVRAIAALSAASPPRTGVSGGWRWRRRCDARGGRWWSRGCRGANRRR